MLPIVIISLILSLPYHQPMVSAAADPASASETANSLCRQELQRPHTNAGVHFVHWTGLSPDVILELPSCAANFARAAWFEGHAPGRRARLPRDLSGGCRLFAGCGSYFMHRPHRFVLHLRQETCGKGPLSMLQPPVSLTVTCSSEASAPSAAVPGGTTVVHVLQLAGDQRCPPGTARDRLGLCRSCSPDGDPCCWQPNWDALACPPGCGGGGFNDPAVSLGDIEALTVDHQASPPLWLQRVRRAAAGAKVESESRLIGKVNVDQLACPNRLSVVATVTCLLEMLNPIRSELISLFVAAFATLACLCMPIYVCYVLSQLYIARFLPFFQFHLFERSALLTSSMRTQAMFSPSLWDFVAFREAEKRRRLAQKKIATGKRVDDFRLRDLQNVLLWQGLPD